MEDGKKIEPLSDEELRRIWFSLRGTDVPELWLLRLEATITDLKERLLIKEGALEIQGGELALATDEYAKMQARAESAEQENKRLKTALEEISRQKIGDEIGDEGARDNADYEMGYEMSVKTARAALSPQQTHRS